MGRAKEFCDMANKVREEKEKEEKELNTREQEEFNKLFEKAMNAILSLCQEAAERGKFEINISPSEALIDKKNKIEVERGIRSDEDDGIDSMFKIIIWESNIGHAIRYKLREEEGFFAEFQINPPLFKISWGQSEDKK